MAHDCKILMIAFRDLERPEQRIRARKSPSWVIFGPLDSGFGIVRYYKEIAEYFY